MSDDPPPARAVLFDLDGTLLDTLADLAASGNAVLEARGFPPHPVDAYRTYVGAGMDHLVRAIFPEGSRPAPGPETEAVLRDYRAAYEARWQDATRPYEGIEALLEALVARGIALGVVSNKAHDFTQRCVEAFLPGLPWGAVLGAREGQAKKPDPAGALEAASMLGVDPGDCLFVGDSDVDMETARNAGMRPVGVAWGFRPISELLEAGAEWVIGHPGALLDLVKSGPEA
jgi:phosphoglycolate phosphatase